MNSFFTYFAFLAPHEFTYIPFPVKALKIILHDLQSGGESAVIPTPGESVQDDDVRLFLAGSSSRVSP
jgi:hypothetical protein